MTKEEYIEKEIKRREERIERINNSLIESQKHAIELLKNLSDEEFESIQEKKDEEMKIDTSFFDLIEKAGVSIDDIDEVEIVSDETLNKLRNNLSTEDFKELVEYLTQDS